MLSCCTGAWVTWTPTPRWTTTSRVTADCFATATSRSHSGPRAKCRPMRAGLQNPSPGWTGQKESEPKAELIAQDDVASACFKAHLRKATALPGLTSLGPGKAG